MATLTSQQLKDSYQSLVTIGDSITSNPTSGVLENGLGNPITRLGIGTSTEDWSSIFDVLRVGKTASLFSYDSIADGVFLANNVYFDTTLSEYAYISTDPATLYQGINGDHIFSNAPSGTADTQATFTERLRIDSGGDISFRDTSNNEAFYWDASTARLGLGTTSPSAPLTIGYSGAEAQIQINNSGDNRMVYLGAFSANEGILRLFNSSNVETVRIPAESTVGVHTYFNAGNVGIGTNTPTDMLNISSASNQIGLDTGDQTTYGTLDVGHFTNGAFIGTQAGSNTVSDLLRLGTSGTERMRIDSSGNVGIGTTSPSAPLEVNVGINSLKISGRDTYIDSTIDSTNANIYVTQAGVGDFAQELGHLVLQARTQGSVYRDIIFAGGLSNGEALMTIQGEGNVGIGATNIYADGLSVGNTDNNSFISSGGENHHLTLASVGASGTLRFFTQGGTNGNRATTESMRIDTSGRLLINGTSANTSGMLQVFFNDAASAPANYGASFEAGRTNSSLHIAFENPNGVVGSIQTLNSATSYNTSSDYRLKENVVEMTGALDRVDQLKPSRFNFIADADTTVDGFLAHEVADVVPEAITGEKDATEEYEVTPAVLDDEGNVIEEAVMGTKPVYQGIDHSKLVPILVGAIQELRAEIEQLKNQ